MRSFFFIFETCNFLVDMSSVSVLQNLSFREVRTYLFAGVFVVGNIVFPQLCHLIPGGGLVWLPIYFFTLVASYVYGPVVGILTAVLSPLANNLLFGMPPSFMLPIIICKSTFLAIAASLIARQFGKITLLLVALAVFGYQFIGTLFEWAYTGSLALAIQDVRIGFPGLLLQICGGYIVIKLVSRLKIW